jgi:hypothetical protein
VDDDCACNDSGSRASKIMHSRVAMNACGWFDMKCMTGSGPYYQRALLPVAGTR